MHYRTQRIVYNTWRPSGQSLTYVSVPFLRCVQKSRLVNNQYGHIAGEERRVQLQKEFNMDLSKHFCIEALKHKSLLCMSFLMVSELIRDSQLIHIISFLFDFILHL